MTSHVRTTPAIMKAVLTSMPNFAKVGLEVPVGTNQQDLSAETALEPFSHVVPRPNRTLGRCRCVNSHALAGDAGHVGLTTRDQTRGCDPRLFTLDPAWRSRARLQRFLGCSNCCGTLLFATTLLHVARGSFDVLVQGLRSSTRSHKCRTAWDAVAENCGAAHYSIDPRQFYTQTHSPSLSLFFCPSPSPSLSFVFSFSLSLSVSPPSLRLSPSLSLSPSLCLSLYCLAVSFGPYLGEDILFHDFDLDEADLGGLLEWTEPADASQARHPGFTALV